ncbi:MAG: 50S ribosomal protein L6 [Omnitrophica bacterium RIFCSPLOWO2_12_FULL_50_11]|nr:MAG: 50S ribosomal protein L6 [Omnitrophica bacterium RIFCSPLOWO2_12_FULL_50_11]
MSRIGNRAVSIPKGVKVQISGEKIHVEGPKGKLDLETHPRMKIELRENEIKVTRPTNTSQDKSLHGLTRTLIHNMIQGVSEEFVKRLEIEGIGFRAELKGKILQLQLGFSHPISYLIPEGVRIEVPKPTVLEVKGPDKALVGQVAANIRSFFVPEPYKGKGIRYSGEVIRRKAGKAAG